MVCSIFAMRKYIRCSDGLLCRIPDPGPDTPANDTDRNFESARKLLGLVAADPENIRVSDVGNVLMRILYFNSLISYGVSHILPGRDVKYPIPKNLGILLCNGEARDIYREKAKLILNEIPELYDVRNINMAKDLVLYVIAGDTPYSTHVK